MTTTKKDLALEISERLGVKKQLAYEVVDTLFKAMRESLISGDRIEIRGFGVLGVKNTKPKPAARNPRTGEIVYVPARKKSYFKAGVLIKKRSTGRSIQQIRWIPDRGTDDEISGRFCRSGVAQGFNCQRNGRPHARIVPQRVQKAEPQRRNSAFFVARNRVRFSNPRISLAVRR